MITTKTDIERIEKLPIFFIISRPRSGSTLLRTLMDSHPNIIIPFESRFIQYLYYKYKRITKWNIFLILSFYNDLIILPETTHLNFDKEELKKNLLKAYQIDNTVSYPTLCKIVYLHFNSVYEKDKVSIIGDRNTRSFFFMEKSLALFPNAKVIHLTRDYRDNILSYLKVKFEPKIVASLAYRWKYYNKIIVNFKKKHPDIVYNIKYEDLVINPEFYLKEICQFLEIDYNASMLNYHSKLGEYKNIMYRPHHNSLLAENINPNNISGWKMKMKPYHIKIADMVVGSFAEKMGYKREYTSKNISLYSIALFGMLYGAPYCFMRAMANKSYWIMRIFYAFFRKFSFLFERRINKLHFF